MNARDKHHLLQSCCLLCKLWKDPLAHMSFPFCHSFQKSNHCSISRAPNYSKILHMLHMLLKFMSGLECTNQRLVQNSSHHPDRMILPHNCFLHISAQLHSHCRSDIHHNRHRRGCWVYNRPHPPSSGNLLICQYLVLSIQLFFQWIYYLQCWIHQHKQCED